MATVLRSFLSGRWQEGEGPRTPLYNPSTEEVVAETSTAGIDCKHALDFARGEGASKLRAMTFAQRGEVLKSLAKTLTDGREELIGLGIVNAGNTRSDAKFDIDGAAATLMFYAELGRSLGDSQVLIDGEGIQLGRSARLFGQHIRVPRRGVAVQINAFNFPAWGMAEKLAVSLLAGVPVISKPATATALMAHRIAEKWVAAAAIPDGAFSFVCGSTGALLQHLGGQDMLAFTGSGETAAQLRATPSLVRENTHVNIEADSLNAAVLGPDVAVGSETWNLFVADVVKEMTQKTGQKCTAFRRVYAPAERLEEVREALSERLSGVRVGNPADEKVTMGPVATDSQLRAVREGIERLAQGGETASGGSMAVEGIGSPAGKGYFVSPTLIVRREPKRDDAVNTHEVFGPVATLMPYRDVPALAEQIAAGGGGLLSSIYSDDRGFVKAALLEMAPFHGRITLGSEKVAGQSVPPGTVMPHLLHGGPGRAGGGEELGGLRGLGFYTQRVAVQGDRALIESLLRVG